MIFLSKLLPLFFYPLGLACLLILALLAFAHMKRWQKSVLGLALLLLWLGGNSWVAYGLTRSLEWQYLPQGELPQADAIVVLGGGTEPQDYPRQTVELNGAGDRVLYAADLYQQGKAPYILASGGRLPWAADQTSTPASEMNSLLQKLGVPQEVIWLETRSVNTQENASYAKPILEEHNVKRILLVTSARHMPRAVRLFEGLGFDVIPAATDFTVTQSEWNHLMHPDWQTFVLGLFPDVSALSMSTSALKEYLGIAVYQLEEASP
jgi:uncharacterized SAM-binding protein YcdF (DUF218 family)